MYGAPREKRPLTKLPAGNAHLRTLSEREARMEMVPTSFVAFAYSLLRQVLSMAPAMRSRRRTGRLRPATVWRTRRAPREWEAKESESADVKFLLRKTASRFPAAMASLPSMG